MCTQVYVKYQCGCKDEGEFKQCDAKYNAESNLQCDHTQEDERTSRNYCAKHLPMEGKALTEHTGRQARK